jgi:Zn-dependent peptidase ImmA (M78 family)
VDAKNSLPINPTVLRWARERAGFSMEDAKLAFKKIEAWEAGEAFPSYAQLEQLADKFKCPVAVFFFPKPPNVPAIEQSFRTLSSADLAAMPRSIRLLLRKGQAMQLNLAELNDGKNASPKLITRDLKFTQATSLDRIAVEVRRYLGISLEEQVSWKGPEQALDEWREAFAQAGVFVFKDAFHAVSHFGFCLYDDEFPIVFVNNSSAKSRQIFTLFHELGHLLFHTSGIDGLDDQFIRRLPANEQRIEVICNGLASRLLVPDDAFDHVMAAKSADRAGAAELAAYFKVSREVIYRKMLDRGLIDQQEYIEASRWWASQVKPPKPGSGNYYNSQYAYLGRRYVDLAFTRYHQRRFDEVQLAEYLNIKPKNLATFEAKFAGDF